MPHLSLDTEAANLVVIAVEMLQAALTSRLERADPDKVISDSLRLQSNKLEVAMAQLSSGDPPEWEMLAEGVRRRALDLMTQLTGSPVDANNAARWRELRLIANTAGFPARPGPRHVRLPKIQEGRRR